MRAWPVLVALTYLLLAMASPWSHAHGIEVDLHDEQESHQDQSRVRHDQHKVVAAQTAPHVCCCDLTGGDPLHCHSVFSGLVSALPLAGTGRSHHEHGQLTQPMSVVSVMDYPPPKTLVS